ncbi:hypothetical protein [Yinghuangia seranimata]|uniref:hypothetical protein n=1 Tax=Yinghuangia seranimata TaxID=408067 RepID=UPI00248D05BE|nr:hypothetical protein [Yinghuangia seranimata]MDI2128510.1 hypothetical protein [Yinghuangia seranimata]
MGTDGFSLHPNDLRVAAGVFATEGAALQHAVTAWQEAVAKAGECWGGDESGKKFAADYVPAHDSMAKALSVLAQGVPSVDPALRYVADNTVDQDQTNASKLG